VFASPTCTASSISCPAASVVGSAIPAGSVIVTGNPSSETTVPSIRAFADCPNCVDGAHGVQILDQVSCEGC
jgi:hypothetical protein